MNAGEKPERQGELGLQAHRLPVRTHRSGFSQTTRQAIVLAAACLTGQEDCGLAEWTRLEGGPKVVFTFSLGETNGLVLVKSMPTMPKSHAGI
jgi:hypothetical protein